mmetsp:Transcript_2652/g.8306  ORF Transcript_2652/g.8306 Transcript_2652/m.8306 type:complete len:217 (-) Transcript_2652:442-1092(-)
MKGYLGWMCDLLLMLQSRRSSSVTEALTAGSRLLRRERTMSDSSEVWRPAATTRRSSAPPVRSLPSSTPLILARPVVRESATRASAPRPQLARSISVALGGRQALRQPAPTFLRTPETTPSAGPTTAGRESRSALTWTTPRRPSLTVSSLGWRARREPSSRPASRPASHHSERSRRRRLGERSAASPKLAKSSAARSASVGSLWSATSTLVSLGWG